MKILTNQETTALLLSNRELDDLVLLLEITADHMELDPIDFGITEAKWKRTQKLHEELMFRFKRT